MDMLPQPKGGTIVSGRVKAAGKPPTRGGTPHDGIAAEGRQQSRGEVAVGHMATATGKQPRQARARKLRTQIAKLEDQLRALNVVEAPRVILPKLHDAGTGRIDAQKVAEFMGVPLKRLSEGLGLNYKAVHRNPSAASFQKALMPVKRSLEYLQQAFQKPEIIRAWLNTPHPMLEDQTSLATILEGKAFAIERLLGNAWEGVVS